MIDGHQKVHHSIHTQVEEKHVETVPLGLATPPEERQSVVVGGELVGAYHWEGIFVILVFVDEQALC